MLENLYLIMKCEKYVFQKQRNKIKSQIEQREVANAIGVDFTARYKLNNINVLNYGRLLYAEHEGA